MNLIKKIQPHFFWLPSALMIADAVSKLLFPDLWVEHARLNFQDRIIWIGIVELCCTLIYIFPVTMSIGFFLICCYWGAAIGIGVNNQQFYILPLFMFVCFSLSFHWRGGSVFFRDLLGKKK